MPQASQNPLYVGAVENAGDRQMVVLLECSLDRVPTEQSRAAAVLLVGPSRSEGPTFCRQGVRHGRLEHRSALRLAQGRVQDIWDTVRAGPAANAPAEGAFGLGDYLRRDRYTSRGSSGAVLAMGRDSSAAPGSRVRSNAGRQAWRVMA